MNKRDTKPYGSRLSLRNAPRQPHTGLIDAAVNYAVEGLEGRVLLAVTPAGAEFQVNTYTGGFQVAPRVAMSPSGAFVTVWHNQDNTASTDDGVYAQRYDTSGARQGTEFRVNTFTQGAQRDGSIAMDANGNFVVAWSSVGQDGSGVGAYAQRFSAAGVAQGPEFRLNTTTAGDQYGPQVAMGSAGDFVAIWETGPNIVAQKFDSTGARVGGEFNVNSLPATTSTSPEIAMAANGNFVVAWESTTTGTPFNSVHGQLFTSSGQKIGSEFVVSSATDAVIYMPTIGFDASNRFDVVWTNNVNGNQDILARQYDASGAPLGPVFVASEKTGGSIARINVFAGGNFVVTWTTANLDDIAYRYFDANGVPTSPELRANTYTAAKQYLPWIAADATGQFVIVWTSDNQDGDKTGIFGQRFINLPNPSAVTGMTWDDLNGDGVRDATEHGMAGVSVVLFNSAGAMAGGAITDASGQYRFDNLRAGDGYYIQWTLPSNRLFSLADQGADDTVDSDANLSTGRSPVFTAAASGLTITSIDAGLTPPASVGGIVWNDSNLNGLLDPVELGRDGVSVNLLNAAGEAISTKVTANGGAYRFDGLQPGVLYSLQFLPLNLAMTTADVGTDDSLDSDPNVLTRRTAPFALPAGQFSNIFNAGLIAAATVAGNVFRDSNGNSQRDTGEAALSGWIVYLDFNANDQRDSIEPLVNTDSSGNFSFSNLSPGTYRVGAIPPEGWLIDSPIAQRTATAAVGQTVSNLILGFNPITPGMETVPLGAETQVNQTTANFQGVPAVAGNASGNYVAVWIGVMPGGSAVGLYGRLYDSNGVPQSDEILLNSNSATSSQPSVGMDLAGNFVVAWQVVNGILVQQFSPTGVARGASKQANQFGGNQSRPYIAVNSSGAFAVTFSSLSTFVPYFRTYDASGNPTSDQILATDDGAGAQVAVGVAMDATGKVTVAWIKSATGGVRLGIYARQFDATGAAKGAAFSVQQSLSGTESDGTVAGDAAGNLVFAWKKTGGVVARRFGSDGTPRGSDFTVFNQSVGTGLAATILANGSFVIAWSTNGNGSISGQLFDPFGIAHGRAFRVITTLAGDWPALAPLSGGAFVAAWESAHDGSDDGVYTQRFDFFNDAQRVSVGDFVWNDTNGDGIQNAGEAGLDGVTVELTNVQGAIVDSQVTSGGGKYVFNVLKAQNQYRLHIITPTGKLITAADQGTSNLLDNDFDPISGIAGPFQVASGSDTSFDAGFIVSASISGTVYYDSDNSNSKGASDPTLAGWTVYLDTNGNGQLDAGETSILTNSTGAYSFANLRPGTYHVREIGQSYWSQITTNAAMDRTLTIGQIVTGNDINNRPSGNTVSRSEPIGPEFRVNSTTAGDQVASSVASNGVGAFVVAWVATDGVYAQLYNLAGAPQSGEIKISSTPGSFSSVAVDHAGNFVIAWSNSQEIFARRFDSAGLPRGAEFQVNTTATGVQTRPDVASDAAGDFVIIWQSQAQDGSGNGIYGQSYDATGAPKGGEFLANQFTANDQTKPSVAMDSAGNFVAAWESKHVDGTQQGVFARRFDATGQALGAEFSVDFPSSGTQLAEPEVGMNAGGDFVIAYRGSDASGTGVFARRFNPQGVPQGNSFLVNVATGGNQDAAAVSVADDGTFAIAWDESNQVDVRVQRFNSAGVRLGSDVLANTTTTDSQIDPTVAIYPGGFVVAWSSNLQDGSGYGIYAHRFTTYDNPASVGHRVFVDANNNGIQDANETGLDNVKVKLIGEQGAVLSIRNTAGGGQYQFDGLRPGENYTLNFTLPTGYTFSPQDRGGSDNSDSDVNPATGNTAPFTLSAGQTDLTRDAGVVPLTSIAGTLFDDANANGIFDTGESTLSGWTIYLDSNANGQLDPAELSTTSNATGNYNFAGLNPGSYRLAVVPVMRWISTTPLGSLNFTLVPGQNRSASVGFSPTSDLHFPHPVGGERAAPSVGSYRSTWRDDLIATNSHGMSVMVGESGGNDGDQAGVFGARMDANGDQIGPIYLVNTTTVGSQYDPTVAIDDAGNSIYAWQSLTQDNGKPGIYAQSYNAAGQKIGSEFQINSTHGKTPKSPASGMDPAGDSMIAWAMEDSDGFGIYAQRFNASGNPVGGEFQVNTITAKDQLEPDIAFDAAGNSLIIWENHSSGKTEIWARRYNAAGNPLGNDFRISDPKSDPQDNASVSMNASGEFVVAWEANAHIYVSRFSSQGVRQGGEMQATVGLGVFPFVALADDGTFDVVWRANDQNGFGIFSRIFNGSGIPTQVFQVNTITVDDELDPFVTTFNGRFNVLWYNRLAATRLQQYDTDTALAQIGGFAWNDTDGNGIYDLAEQPAANVTINLQTPDGGNTATTVTDADGNYRFASVQAGASYRISPVYPSGKAATSLKAGSDHSVDSDIDPTTGYATVTAPAIGRIDLSIGVGLVAPGGISGAVYDDLNSNGIRDTGEPTLAGWTVFIDADGNGVPGNNELSTITDNNGAYSFNSLGTATYKVRAVSLELWTQKTSTSLLNTSVLPGQQVTGVDIGFVTSASDSRAVPLGPTQIANSGSGATGRGLPVIATNASGKTVVVWQSQDQDGGGLGIYGQVYDAVGNKVGAEFRANTFTTFDQSNPSVAMDASGNFIVVWQSTKQLGDYTQNIYGQRFDNQGNRIAGEFQINTTADGHGPPNIGGESYYPVVSMSASGKFVVAWDYLISGNSFRLYFQGFDADGNRVGGEQLINSGGFHFPSVAIDANGNTLLVYTAGLPNFQGAVFLNRFNPDFTLAAGPMQIDAQSEGPWRPSVAVDAVGNFAVSWATTSGPTEYVRARRFNAAGVPQGGDIDLGRLNNGAPAVAYDGQGNLIVSWWAHPTDNLIDLAVQRFNAAGLQLGQPMYLQANGDYGTRPAVGADDRGDFAVAWTQGTNVAYRRFTLDHAPTIAAVPPDITLPQASPDSLVDLYAAFADDRDPDSAMTYSIVQNTSPGLFTSASINQGLLRLSYVSSAAGSALLTVRATDSGGQFVQFSFNVTVIPTAPVISGVFAAGTLWKPAFLTALAINGQGDATYGYHLDPAAAQPAALGYGNIDRLSIRFSADIQDTLALSIIDSGGSIIPLTSIAYDPATHTRTWSLSGLPGGVLPQGRLHFVLTQTGKGNSSNSNLFTLLDLTVSVLSGDASHDGNVGFTDLVALAQNYGSANIAGDFNGDGVVDFADLVTIAQNYGKSLPPLPAPAVAVSSPPVVAPSPVPAVAASFPPVVAPPPIPFSGSSKSAPTLHPAQSASESRPLPATKPSAARTVLDPPPPISISPAPKPAIFNSRKRVKETVWNA